MIVEPVNADKKIQQTKELEELLDWFLKEN